MGRLLLRLSCCASRIKAIRIFNGRLRAFLLIFQHLRKQLRQERASTLLANFPLFFVLQQRIGSGAWPANPSNDGRAPQRGVGWGKGKARSQERREMLRLRIKKGERSSLPGANRLIANRRLAENPSKQTVGANKKAGGSGQGSPRASKPKAEAFRSLGEKKWWNRQDLNLRPRDYESPALTD